MLDRANGWDSFVMRWSHVRSSLSNYDVFVSNTDIAESTSAFGNLAQSAVIEQGQFLRIKYIESKLQSASSNI